MHACNTANFGVVVSQVDWLGIFLHFFQEGVSNSMQPQYPNRPAGNQLCTIRRYREGDEEQILRLRKLCFGSSDLDEWIWEFKRSPLGSLMMVAEAKGQIVGFRAHLNVKMKVGDEVVKGSIACDSMVHPDYRRRGLWRKLSRMEWEESTKEGNTLSYSFSNKVSFKYKPKENIAICRVPILVKFFDTYGEIKKRVGNQILAKILSIFVNSFFRVFYRVKKCPPVETVLLSEITEFDDRIDSFWSQASTAFKIAVVRDKEYLNWRYFQRPNSNFKVLLAEDGNKILGYIVFSVQRIFDDRIGYIIDIVTHPDRPEIIPFLISSAIDRIRKEKASLILCKMMKNNAYYKIVRKNGFIQVLGSHLVARINQSKVSEVFVRDPNNWYLTFGDSDGILLPPSRV
jgi:ribosomal protein S18 acetylase RimI-like enzyme